MQKVSDFVLVPAKPYSWYCTAVCKRKRISVLQKTLWRAMTKMPITARTFSRLAFFAFLMKNFWSISILFKANIKTSYRFSTVFLNLHLLLTPVFSFWKGEALYLPLSLIAHLLFSHSCILTIIVVQETTLVTEAYLCTLSTFHFNNHSKESFQV